MAERFYMKLSQLENLWKEARGAMYMLLRMAAETDSEEIKERRRQPPCNIVGATLAVALQGRNAQRGRAGEGLVTAFVILHCQIFKYVNV